MTTRGGACSALSELPEDWVGALGNLHCALAFSKRCILGLAQADRLFDRRARDEHPAGALCGMHEGNTLVAVGDLHLALPGASVSAVLQCLVPCGVFRKLLRAHPTVAAGRGCDGAPGFDPLARCPGRRVRSTIRTRAAACATRRNPRRARGLRRGARQQQQRRGQKTGQLYVIQHLCELRGQSEGTRCCVSTDGACGSTGRQETGSFLSGWYVADEKAACTACPTSEASAFRERLIALSSMGPFQSFRLWLSKGMTRVSPLSR